MFANITQENHFTLHDPDCYVYGYNCKVSTNMIIKYNRNLNGGLFDLQNMQLFVKKSPTHCFNKAGHAITSLTQ